MKSPENWRLRVEEQDNTLTLHVFDVPQVSLYLAIKVINVFYVISVILNHINIGLTTAKQR